MALARETLSGPFPFRGLHDFPERADYGNASLARNVDFGDGWMRPRLGTEWAATVRSAGGADVISTSFDLVRHFADGGASLLAMVTKYSPTSSIRVCIDSPFGTGVPWYSDAVASDSHSCIVRITAYVLTSSHYIT